MMLQTAQALVRWLMVAHVCRFMAQYGMAKELIDSGRLGKPLFFNAWRLSATPGWSAQNWMGNKAASGGTVMDLQIHEIDLALWLLGPAKNAVLTQRQSEKLRGSGFCHAVSTLQFESGAAAALEAGHLMPEGYEQNSGYRLVLEDGALEFGMTGQDAHMRLNENGKTSDLTYRYVAECAGSNPYLNEIRHFIACVETGEDFLVKAVEARDAVRTVLELSDITKNRSQRSYCSRTLLRKRRTGNTWET